MGQKKYIKSICEYIGELISILHPIIIYIGKLNIYFYSGYKKRCFESIGQNPIITPLCKKINGGNIGNNCVFGRRIWIDEIKQYQQYSYNPLIVIGDNCNFGDHNHIGAINKIIIGNGVLTGQNVLIEDHSHGYCKEGEEDLRFCPNLRPLVSKGPIIIEDNVWIGDKVIICGGVTIGEGSIIGANSVVTHDVRPFSVVAGVPAKIIRKMK